MPYLVVYRKQYYCCVQRALYKVQLSVCLQNEIRSLVSLGDGAAGGGGGGGGGSSSVSGLSVGPRGLGSGSGGGSGTSSGEPSNKRAGSGSGSGSGRTPTSTSKKKKENSSGPLLFDNAIEWWKRDKVSGSLIQKINCMCVSLSGTF